MFIIAIILVVIVIFIVYIGMRKEKSTLIKPKKRRINELYKSGEGEFKIIGHKDDFIVSKNENLEFLVVNGQIVASRDKRVSKEFVYYGGKQ